MKPLLLFVALFTSLYATAQTSNTTETTPRKNLFIEVGGNGIAFNVVGETRFKPGPGGWGVKLGAGGFSTPYGERLFTVPLQLNYLASRNGRDFFEAGLGAGFLHYTDGYDNTYTYQRLGPNGQLITVTETYKDELINLELDKKNSVYGNMTLGYRRQPRDGGIMWGVALTPHFNQNGFWPVWVGLKLGYSFKK